MEYIYLDYIIPIVTFGLGVLFTYFWDKHKKIENEYHKSAIRLSQLVSDWYNQLWELDINKRFNDKEFDQKLFFYSQNRLVLPEYLRLITYLKGSKKNSKLVESAEEFLSLVTDYEYNNNFNYKENTYTKTIKCINRLYVSHKQRPEWELVFGKDSYFQKLDSLVQKIAIESVSKRN